MKQKYQKKNDSKVKLAKERISGLFLMASEVFNEDSSLADRYVKIARTIAMKFKIRLESSVKRRFCKHCHSYLVPGKNLRVRVNKGRIVYYCLVCKKFWRRPLKKEISFGKSEEIFPLIEPTACRKVCGKFMQRLIKMGDLFLDKGKV